MRRYLPLIMVSLVVFMLVVAPRSSVLVLIVLGLLSLASIVKNKSRPRLFDHFGVCIAALIIWVCLSLLWSPAHDAVMMGALKVCAILIVGMLCIKAFDVGWRFENVDLRGALIVGSLGGISLVCIAAVYAKTTGYSLWGSYYFDPLTTLNASAVFIALVIWPCVVVLARIKVTRAVMLLLGATIILAFLSSTAALSAVIIGAITAAGRRYLGRNAGIAFAFAASMLVIVMPYAVEISGANIYSDPVAVNDTSSPLPYSARHRLAMWAFATEKIDEKPWLGWGFGSSRYIPQEDHRLAPNMEIMPLHPHNLALQTRLELGLPGVMILAALVFLVFHRLATFTDDPWKSGVAMAAASGWLFVANVSYGMWQSWWIALAFVLVLLMKISFYVQTPKGDLRG